MTTLYIPDGLKSRYVESGGGSESVEEDINKLCQKLVTLYTSNSMKTFWSPIDLIIGHIVMSNHLLNGLDSQSLIKDIMNHESIFCDIEELLHGWVTQCNRQTFNESVKKFEELSKPQRDALIQAINVCVVLVDEDEQSTKITTDDASRLYDIVKKLRVSQPNKEWIKLRLNLVADMLDTKNV